MPATAKIFGDTSHLRRALRSGSRDFEQFGAGAERALSRADRAGTKLLSTFTAVGVAGTRSFMEINRTVNYTIGLVEDLDRRSGEYIAGLRDISARRGVGLGEVAWAGYGGISAGQGVGGTQTLRYVDLIAAMQTGFANITGQSAAEYVGKMSQAVKMPVGLISDYTAFTEAQGTTDFARLVSAAPKFASLGYDLGIGFDEQMAMMAVASTYQPTSDEAGTGIARMFEEAMNPNAVFYKKFKSEMGRTVREAISEGEGAFLDLLMEYRRRVGAEQFMASFGSKRGGLVAQQLTSTSRAQDLIPQYQGAYGLTMRAADRMLADTPGLWSRVKTQAETLLNEAGEGIDDAVKDILSTVIDTLADPDLRSAVVSATQMLADLDTAGIKAAAALLRVAADVGGKDIMPGPGEVSILETLLLGALGVKGLKYGKRLARGAVSAGGTAWTALRLGGLALTPAGVGAGTLALGAGGILAGGALAVGAINAWGSPSPMTPYGQGIGGVPLDEYGLPTDYDTAMAAYRRIMGEQAESARSVHPVWSIDEYVQHYRGPQAAVAAAQAGVRPPSLRRVPPADTREIEALRSRRDRYATEQAIRDRDTAVLGEAALMLDVPDPTERQLPDRTMDIAALDARIALLANRLSAQQESDSTRQMHANIRAIKIYDQQILAAMEKTEEHTRQLAERGGDPARTSTSATIYYQHRAANQDR